MAMKSRSRAVRLAAFILICSSSNVFPQQTPKPATAAEVVVTATRFSEAQSELPVGVTVITAEQIGESTAANVPELLMQVPGIHVRDNSGSPNQQVDMRGFGIFGDQNTLVLLDGQRISENEQTSVNWAAIPLSSIERIEIIQDLRNGEYDVLVGVNLLREGLDLPEVSLVAILDADKEGFLRAERSLIQTIGRAARHVEGVALLYADNLTDSMAKAISETERRRAGVADGQRGNQRLPGRESCLVVLAWICHGLIVTQAPHLWPANPEGRRSGTGRVA